LKRSIEFKVLKHVSKFTNDLVEKDYFINSHYKTITLQKTKFLPKLKNSNLYNQKANYSSSEKFYDTRGII